NICSAWLLVGGTLGSCKNTNHSPRWARIWLSTGKGTGGTGTLLISGSHRRAKSRVSRFSERLAGGGQGGHGASGARLASRPAAAVASGVSRSPAGPAAS